MTVAERLYRWNSWYDGLPQEWRFQVILWPLIALGACNMLLSLSMQFPFGLLVLLGVLCVAAVRVPYALGWIAPTDEPASGEPGTRKLEIGGAGADWLIGLNQRYEAIPEARRFWVFPAILVIAGAINMQLTIDKGYPFGLIFLIVLLAVIVMRAPYAHGLLKSPSAVGIPAPALRYDARLTQTHSSVSANAHSVEPHSVELATPNMPAERVPQHEMREVNPNETTPSVETGPASQPGHSYDDLDSLHPTVPPRSELAPEEIEARAASNVPAPPSSHPPESSRTE